MGNDFSCFLFLISIWEIRNRDRDKLRQYPQKKKTKKMLVKFIHRHIFKNLSPLPVDLRFYILPYFECPCDTDQVSVGGCWGSVHPKVLVGHFRWRLAVAEGGQQAEQQHPAEHPGAIHGAGAGGGGGGGRRSPRVRRRTGGGQEELGVAADLRESLLEPLLSL